MEEVLVSRPCSVLNFPLVMFVLFSCPGGPHGDDIKYCNVGRRKKNRTYLWSLVRSLQCVSADESSGQFSVFFPRFETILMLINEANEML